MYMQSYVKDEGTFTSFLIQLCPYIQICLKLIKTNVNILHLEPICVKCSL